MKIRDYVLTLALVGLLGAFALAVLVGSLTASMGRDADRYGELSTLANEASDEFLTSREFLSNGRQMLNAMDVLTKEYSGLFMYVEAMLEVAEDGLENIKAIPKFPAQLQATLEVSLEQYEIQSRKVGIAVVQNTEVSPGLDQYQKAAEAFAMAMDDLEVWAEGLVTERRSLLHKERQRIDAWRKEAYFYMGGAGLLYLVILAFFAWRTHRVIIAPITRMAFAADESIENDLRFTNATFTETPWTKPKGKQFKKTTGPKEIEVLSRRLWDLVHGLEETVSARTKQLVERTFNLEEEIRNRMDLELELLHAQKMKAVGQLTAGIAHEIRTPTQYVGDHLLFVKEATQKLLELSSPQEDDREDAFIREHLLGAVESSLKGVDRISEIVTSMKRFSYKDKHFAKQPADLNQAVLDTVSITTNEWKNYVVLETELDPKLPMVECHLGEINQVIMNLIVNASHAVRDHKKGAVGNVVIRTRSIGNDQVEIEIEDDGGGMTEEVGARIFEPFFTTKAVGVGSGQGLAISHSVIVTKHGGELTFETELGKGTIFKVQLPVKGKAEESSEGKDYTI